MHKAPRTTRVIVNADDFGMSTEANHAIVGAFEKGLISSATLMANMPGFVEACELAHRHHLIGRVGVHLNITSGHPLSTPILSCSRLCDDTCHFRARHTRFHLSAQERLAVETEMGAQVRACLDRGLRPTHLDSHHHVHTEWAIGAAAIAIAQRYGISAIRLSRNCGPGMDGLHRVYKLAYNLRLRVHGLAKTRYFGSFTDVQEILSSSGDIEIMVHLTAGGSVETAEGIVMHKLQRSLSKYQLVSYS